MGGCGLWVGFDAWIFGEMGVSARSCLVSFTHVGFCHVQQHIPNFRVFFFFLTEFLSRSPEGNRAQVFSPGWLDGWAVSRYLPYRAMQS